MLSRNSQQHYSQSQWLHGSWLFHWFAWYNSCGTEKCPLAVNGSSWQEQPPEVVLYGSFVNTAVNSAIHKAASSLVTGCSLQNGKMSMGNRRTERPPDPVLYGGRPSGGFVNSAVSTCNFYKMNERYIENTARMNCACSISHSSPEVQLQLRHLDIFSVFSHNSFGKLWYYYRFKRYN